MGVISRMKIEKDIEKIESLIQQGKTFNFEDYQTEKFIAWNVGVAAIIVQHSTIEGDRNTVNRLGELPWNDFKVIGWGYSPNTVEENVRFSNGVHQWVAKLQVILDDLKTQQEEPSRKSHRSDPKENNVFIVHGHDDSMIHEVKLFFYETEGFQHLKPVILRDRISGGSTTVIEKFEREAEQARFAIVLYSPDDIGRAKSENPKSEKARARQNVVWEHGYFVAKLGRERVVSIYKDSDSIEIPSDLNGLIYEKFDGDWKAHLIKELEHVGLKEESHEK